MPGWARALAIAMGLFVIGVGFSAIFFPAIVVGFLTIMFSIAFIFMGFWALSMGLSGRRIKMPQNPTSYQSSQSNLNSMPDEANKQN